METAQRPTIRERAERICNVALSLPRCQPRLSFRRACPCKNFVSHGKVPDARETFGEQLALVVATLAQPRRSERNGDDPGTLLLDVERKAQRTHPARHRRTDAAPPAILVRVHDGLG